MRRQYHSRIVNGNRLIWDVHRLIELSRALPVVDVPLSSIAELDEVFWFNDCDQAPTGRAVAEHAKLMEETDLEYPIILSADGRVMDGMHRVCKALVLGRETIKAVRFPSDPTPDHINVPMDELSYEELW